MGLRRRSDSLEEVWNASVPRAGAKLSKLSSNGASTMTRCGRIRASPAFARLGENLDKLTGVAVRRIHGNNSRSPFEPSGSFSKSVPPARPPCHRCCSAAKWRRETTIRPRARDRRLAGRNLRSGRNNEPTSALLAAACLRSLDQAARTAEVRSFLRRPKSPKAPRPEPNSTSAAGSGVGAGGSVICAVK
jgi:hypothetical protein